MGNIRSQIILLVDDSVNDVAVTTCVNLLNMRNIGATPIRINFDEHLELLQESAESDDPATRSNGFQAFYEAFGIELTPQRGLLVPPGFNDSIRLPLTIDYRFEARSDGTVIDMAQAHAA